MDLHQQQGKEFSWADASRQFPATLYHLHGGDPKKPPLPAVHTHYQYAYGDWEAKSVTALASTSQQSMNATIPSRTKTVLVEDVQTQLMVFFDYFNNWEDN